MSKKTSNKIVSKRRSFVTLATVYTFSNGDEGTVYAYKVGSNDLVHEISNDVLWGYDYADGGGWSLHYKDEFQTKREAKKAMKKYAKTFDAHWE